MADQDDFTAALEMDRRLAVNLGHQRAGRVLGEEIALVGLVWNGLRHAMGGKHHRRAGLRNFVQFRDENRALFAQAFHHIAVMHDFVTHIDRCAIELQRTFHRIDGPDHPGAEASGGTKHD